MTTHSIPAQLPRRTAPAAAQGPTSGTGFSGVLALAALLRRRRAARHQRTAFTRALEEATPTMRSELLAISEGLEIMDR